MKTMKLARRAYVVALHLVLVLLLAKETHRWVFAEPTHPLAENAYYQARLTFLQTVTVPLDATIFAGDSLTDHADWSALLADPTVYNFGIAGDTSTGLLARLPDITRRKPGRLFIMIGINDLTGAGTEQQLLTNYRQILMKVRGESPTTRVVVESLLLTRRGDALNRKVHEVNVQLRTLADTNGAQFLDLEHALADGDALAAKYTFDGLHLNGPAYVAWRDQLHAVR